MGTENGLKYKSQEVKSILIEKFIWKIYKILGHLGQIMQFETV